MREFGTPLNTDGRNPVSEWQTSQKEAAVFNSKAMNAIFNVVSMEEFKRISNIERSEEHTSELQSPA